MVSTLPCMKGESISQWGKREGSASKYMPCNRALCIDSYWKLLVVVKSLWTMQQQSRKLAWFPVLWSWSPAAKCDCFCSRRGDGEEGKAPVQLLETCAGFSTLILPQLFSGVLGYVFCVRLVDFLSLEKRWIAVEQSFVDVCPHSDYSFSL